MNTENTKKLLIINDVTGYGRVSTFAMFPILTKYGLHPYVLPTALVSNTMDYGNCEILETTDFMKKTFQMWSKFGFKFNAISTGFINSDEQADLILSFVKNISPSFLLVDPIMADSGELYPNMNPDSVNYYKKILSVSDICIPNITEARLLADLMQDHEYTDKNELCELVKALQSLGCKNIVITDCKDLDGNSFNYIYDSAQDKHEKIYFEKLPVSYIGTGDVFSSVLTSEILLGSNLEVAVKKASDFVAKVIKDNSNNDDTFDLIIENSLEYIK